MPAGHGWIGSWAMPLASTCCASRATCRTPLPRRACTPKRKPCAPTYRNSDFIDGGKWAVGMSPPGIVVERRPPELHGVCYRVFGRRSRLLKPDDGMKLPPWVHRRDHALLRLHNLRDWRAAGVQQGQAPRRSTGDLPPDALSLGRRRHDRSAQDQLPGRALRRGGGSSVDRFGSGWVTRICPLAGSAPILLGASCASNAMR